ncbi:unnamed protein product [Closterium sp. NIES-64]|nr:unnamed protein product [Closterium sp. NIES-64]
MAEPSKTAAGEPAKASAGVPAGTPAGVPAGRGAGRGVGRGTAAADMLAGRGRGSAGIGRGDAKTVGRGGPVSGTARGNLASSQAEPARQIGAPHVFPRMGRGDIRRAYTLGRELGKGGGGVVRECLDPLTGEPVAACKTIPKSKLQRPDLVEELRAEVAAMRRLAGHAHVVRLLAVYEDDHAVHVVMELCTGGDLYDLLTAATTLPEPIAAQLTR